MVANERLRDACEAWLRAALTYLHGKQVPLQDERQVVWASEQALQIISVPVLDTRLFPGAHRETLASLPELHALTQVVQESAETTNALLAVTDAPALSSTEPAPSSLRSHLDRFLIAYLKHSDAWAPTDVEFVSDRFGHVYAQFEQFIYGLASIDAWWLYQFDNFSTEVDAIPVAPGARLRRATQAERDQAVIDHSRRDVSRATAFPFDARLLIPEVVLEVKRTLTSRSGGFGPDDYGASHQIAQAVLLALRLIKPEPISIDSFQTQVDNPFADLSPRLSGFPPSSFRWDRPLGFPFGSQYVIAPKDVVELQALCRHAQRAVSDPLLTVPLKRLNDSYLRTDLADQLIDYWVALESLFLPEKFAREMTEVVAQAMAHYLGRTVSERKSIAASVHSSHKTRSDIVHGKVSQDKQYEATVAKTGSLLRRALQQRLGE